MDVVGFLGIAAGPFLVIAALLFLVDFFLLYRSRSEERGPSAMLFVGSLIACLFVVASYLILTIAFATDAFYFREVYASSSSTLPLLYKLGGPWIGSSGSLLFITFALALCYGVYRVRGFERETPPRRAVYQALDLVLAFFILATLLQSPFRQLGVAPPEGRGLTPLLQTSWVLVHPPIIFLAYVAVFVAFALLLAGLSRGRDRSDERPLRLWLMAAWLLLTVGIALGGLWSYRVLGWGGYWAWDPVETASLLPWLALTAYFHFAGPGKEAARDALLAVAFFTVVFATVVTRGGFSQSVHAYGASPVGYVFLLFAVAGLLAFLWLRRGSQKVDRASLFAVDTSSLTSIARAVAAWSLVALLAVCFLGSVAPIAGSLLAGAPFTVSPEFFTLACYPFALAFVAALIGCHVAMRTRMFALVIAVLLGIGAVLAAIAAPTPYPLANLGFPLILAAIVAVAYDGIRSGRANLRTGARTVLHLSIPILLLGVFISTAGAAESTPLLATPGATIDALGLDVTLGDFVVSPGTGSVLASQSVVGPEYSGLRADAEVRDGTAMYRGALWMYEYTNYGVVSIPLIIPTPARDLYLSMHQTNSSYGSLVQALAGNTTPPEDVTVVVKTVPLIWLVWLGVLLMVAGMCAALIDELLRARRPHAGDSRP